MISKNELVHTEKQTEILKELQSDKSFSKVLQEKMPQLMKDFLTILYSR